MAGAITTHFMTCNYMRGGFSTWHATPNTATGRNNKTGIVTIGAEWQVLPQSIAAGLHAANHSAEESPILYHTRRFDKDTQTPPPVRWDVPDGFATMPDLQFREQIYWDTTPRLNPAFNWAQLGIEPEWTGGRVVTAVAREINKGRQINNQGRRRRPKRPPEPSNVANPDFMAGYRAFAKRKQLERQALAPAVDAVRDPTRARTASALDDD